jgi:hypothetical protein
VGQVVRRSLWRATAVIVQGSAVEGGEAEGVEEPAETAVVAVFGEELVQLGVNGWAGLAEELFAQFEQLG